MKPDLSAWLASHLSGRITKTDLRTGALLRRTSKIVANQNGLSWECYVNAVSAWLWINNRGTSVALAINRRSPGMGLVEQIDQPFARLSLPVFVRPGTTDAVETCRQLEPFIDGLALSRFEYFTATPDQVTLWNRRPTIERLRARVAALQRQFATERRALS
jgi:hypothetical protein